MLALVLPLNFKPSSSLLAQGVQARGLDLSMSESGSLEGGGWDIGLWALHRGVPCMPANVPEELKKLDLDFIV